MPIQTKIVLVVKPADPQLAADGPDQPFAFVVAQRVVGQPTTAAPGYGPSEVVTGSRWPALDA